MGNDAFELLEPGMYDFEIVTAISIESMASPEFAELIVAVTTGPHTGQEVVTTLLRSTDSVRELVAKLAAAGIPVDWLNAPGATWERVLSQLPGRRFRAEVTNREWPFGSGHVRTLIGDWRPPTGRAA